MNKRVDKIATVVIIIKDMKQEYQLPLPNDFSGKVIFSFQKGVLQGGKREAHFVPVEIKKTGL